MAAATRSILDSAGALGSWWLSELAGLVPGPLRRLGAGRPRRVVVAVGPDQVALYEERAGASPRALGEPVAAADLPGGLEKLVRRLRSRISGPVGVRLPHSACLVRTVELPRAAARDLDRVMALDLARATPFKPADVYTAHVAERAPAGAARIAVRQVIVKRPILDAAVSDVAALGLDVRAADCWDESGTRAVPVNLLAVPAASAPRGSGGRVVGMLLAAALVAAGALAYQVWSRFDAAREEVRALAAADKAKVLSLRRSAEAGAASAELAQSLERARRASPRAIEIVAELTRLLPDTAWVSDLRIEEGRVDIVGQAQSASALLPIIERSAMLVDAAMSAPVTVEGAEGRERFSIRARLRETDSGATSAPGQKKGRP